jgi:hypothetical protein
VRWEVFRDLRNALEKWDSDGRDEDNSPDVFQIIHPRPKEEDDNWYEWNSDNWGTKWDMRVYGFSFIEDELTFCGDTAWNAPIGILNKLVSLGFNMKHLFASMENDDWGYHINRNENGIRVVKNHYGYTHQITDDDLEDFDENQWNAEDLRPHELQDLATLFILTGEFIFNTPEGLDEDDLVYYGDEFRHIWENNHELLEDHINNHINNQEDEDIEEFKEPRTEIMELLEDLKDKGYVNDGFYLWWCNELKGVQQGDMVGLNGISEFLHIEYDERHDMIQYYTATHAKEEPNLIKMYEVF